MGAMPKPKLDRVARSLRLRREIDAMLVQRAEAEGLSINEAVELAVTEWLGTATPTMQPKPKVVPRKPARTRQVEPRWKGKP